MGLITGNRRQDEGRWRNQGKNERLVRSGKAVRDRLGRGGKGIRRALRSEMEGDAETVQVRGEVVWLSVERGHEEKKLDPPTVLLSRVSNPLTVLISWKYLTR